MACTTGCPGSSSTLSPCLWVCGTCGVSAAVSAATLHLEALNKVLPTEAAAQPLLQPALHPPLGRDTIFFSHSQGRKQLWTPSLSLQLWQEDRAPPGYQKLEHKGSRCEGKCSSSKQKPHPQLKQKASPQLPSDVRWSPLCMKILDKKFKQTKVQIFAICFYIMVTTTIWHTMVQNIQFCIYYSVYFVPRLDFLPLGYCSDALQHKSWNCPRMKICDNGFIFSILDKFASL